MGREVLFKGVSVETNKWVYGSLSMLDTRTQRIGEQCGNMFICCTQNAWQRCHSGDMIGYWVMVHSDSVCQFIGITDIHGRKVFEGDILSCKNADGASFEYKCVYNDENACFYFTNTKYGLSLSGDEMLYFDVIGNIHDLNLQL